MRLQEHIDKISWSLTDKLLFFIYGVVQIFQIRASAPEEWGLFGLMIGLHTWVFIVIDSSALQILVQFGMNKENQEKVNAVALILQLILSLLFSLLVYVTRFELAAIFGESGFIKIGVFLPVLIFLTIPRTYVIKLIYRVQDFKKLFVVDATFFGVMIILTLYLILTNSILLFEDMILIYFFGSGISSLCSIFLLRKELKFDFSGDLQIVKMLKFSIPWTFYSAVNYLPRIADIYIIQYFFKTEATGVYVSAKNLFRVFDEGLNASFGLVYPAAVRQIEKNNIQGLNELMTKAVSFLLLAFLTAVAILELGLSEFIITTFLPASYHNAIGQFNLLLVAALGMPFAMLSSVIIAMGKPNVVLRYALIGIVFGGLTLVVVGSNGWLNLIPLGLIVYVFINGILIYLYMNKKYGLKPKYLFRAINDSKSYILSLIRNKNKRD